MARVSTYLTFARETEAAFTFYREVFGTDYAAPIVRYSEMPPQPDQPPMADADRHLVLHVALPILGGHMLMGSDAAGCMGESLIAGNNVNLNLETDSRGQSDALFAALAAGGRITMPMQDMFWGAYFGSVTDRFGICWMINCESQQ
jgi:PhnB protein